MLRDLQLRQENKGRNKPRDEKSKDGWLLRLKQS